MPQGLMNKIARKNSLLGEKPIVFNRTVALKMLANYPVNLVLGEMVVPHIFGINHGQGAALTDSKTMALTAMNPLIPLA